jgi:hypothetical protein
MKKSCFSLAATPIVLMALVLPGLLGATPFTYQGRLQDGANPANGSYDLVFSMFSTNSGGSPASGAVTNSAVPITNGLFTVALDFGTNVFDGSDRWLEISVRTNGAAGFFTLSPRQKIMSAPYAIVADTLTGAVPGSQLSGTGIQASTISSNKFDAATMAWLNSAFWNLNIGVLPPMQQVWSQDGNTYNILFAVTNVVQNHSSGVTLAGIFSGDGGGLTNISAASVSNVPNVINVRDFGAKGDGVTDDTLAISNAQVAQVAQRLPLYFPGRPNGKYYKISGPLRVYDGHTDVRGINSVNSPASDTASRIEIVGDTGTAIVQTSDNSVFVFTNGLNWLKISGLRIASTLRASGSHSPGIALYSEGYAGGQNTDDAIIENTEVDGFKYGLYSESGCSLNLRQLALDNNLWSFWLVNTNNAGPNATGNNSVTFQTCEIVGNYNGGFLQGGGVVIFDGCEIGAPTQTNFVTISTFSSTSVLFRGGNAEQYQGAIVNMVGGGLANTRIRFDNFGFHNFQNAYLVWNTNLSASPYITISESAESGGTIHDDCASHNITVLRGSVLVVGFNPNSGAFTNYIGTGSQQDMLWFSGINYNGPAPSVISEGRFSLKYNYDFKGRTMLSYGAVSNWGPNQVVFNYPLLQYNYDLADGKIPPAGLTTNFSVIGTGNQKFQFQFTRGVLTGIVPQ